MFEIPTMVEVFYAWVQNVNLNFWPELSEFVDYNYYGNQNPFCSQKGSYALNAMDRPFFPSVLNSQH